MTKQKEEPKFDDPLYHEKCARIMSLMQHPGWVDFWGEIQKVKARLQNEDLWTESDISIHSVTKDYGDITVVTVNKDIVKHELQVWARLEKTIETWKAEATRRPGDESERSNEDGEQG